MKQGVLSGLTLPTILTLIFIVLKLCGVIAWSWVLVLLPTIIEVGIVVLLSAIYVISVIVLAIMERREK